MADKRDLKVKQHKHTGKRRDPSPMAWERSQQKRTPRVKETAATADAGEVTETTAVSRERKRKAARRRLIRRMVILFVVVVLGLTIWNNWDSLQPRQLMFWMEQTFSTSGEGYPVEIAGNSVLDVQQAQGYLVVLTDTSVVAFNANGGEVMRRQHNYTNPMLMCDGRYLLVAEIGGKRFRLETMPETVLDVTADNLAADKKTAILDTAIENPLISADVLDDGTVALVTSSSGSYTSEILVYTPSGKLKYRQRYVSMQAVDIAMSPDEEDVAVIGVEADKGVMKSILRIHSLKSEETKPRMEYTGTDVMLGRVTYLDDDQIAAIGDTQTWVVNADGDLNERLSYDRQLVGYAIGEKAIGLALQKYGASDGGELMVVNGEGKTAYTSAFTGDFRHVTMNDDGVLLLTSGQLYWGTYEQMGGNTMAQQDGRMVGRVSDKAIVLGLTALTEYSLTE